MKNLIVYCSSHGTTEKAVGILSESLIGEVITIDLNKESLKMDLNQFDNIIIGGSIHAGSVQRKVKRFIKKHYFELLTKEIGLFLCCMLDGEQAINQFNRAFPLLLRKNANALGLFGGEFLFSKMNFLEKQLVKRVNGVNDDQSHLDIEAIKEFASRMNRVRALV